MDTKTLPPRINNNTSSSSECTSSPEFEFWMVRNPSFPQPNILPADELFVDGVLLPLNLRQRVHQQKTPTLELSPPDQARGPDLTEYITDSSTTTATTLSSSKRWKDIFRKCEKKNAENKNRTEENNTKKKERKGGATTSTELNINIWPFSRSRSSGNSGSRPKLFPGAPAARKVNSAPCSRSNSAGESKSINSLRRAGFHLGRGSPVWQVRKSTTVRRSKLSSPVSGGSAKSKVLNLNVPMCMGYKQNLSCRREENNSLRGSNNGEGNVGNYKLFNLRSLFTKKSRLVIRDVNGAGICGYLNIRIHTRTYLWVFVRIAGIHGYPTGFRI